MERQKSSANHQTPDHCIPPYTYSQTTDKEKPTSPLP
uniref:Uncharacterized protein n=1 Tax=Brassica oleracea TaxID=3712 RepID=A0A3P6DUN7_BRAOL|nr:unnamed protein product [Brassica oleracea]